MKPAITFYGGVGSVTGANFLLEIDGKRILIDCGMVQGSPELELTNYDAFPYDPSSIDMLFVTHAHADHIGRVPKLVRDGFRGVIYSTLPTRDISEIMFHDSINIFRHDTDNHDDEEKESLYSKEDIAQTLTQWKVESYHHALQITDNVTVTFHDAGHILGSAMVKFLYKGKNIVFTGDLGNTPAPLLRDTEIIDNADYLVMESVYGNRNHEQRELRSEIFETIIEDTLHAGGTVMIPAFSVERTQELLFEINNLVEHGRIQSVPVFVDSPLALKVTNIYRESTEYFKPEVRDLIASGDDIFNFKGLKMVESVDESKAINTITGPKIIIAGSGMSNGGRILHHEMRYLPDPKSTLIFVGYQAAGTLGRVIADGARSVTIYHEKVPVRARVESISGYSGHKQMDDLVDFVADTREHLQTVWCVMGELESSMFLAQRLRDYVGVHAVVPEVGERVELEII